MRDFWADEAASILKGILARDRITYRALAEKLVLAGFDENESQLRNKVSRGKFSLLFFLQCMAAIGHEDVRLAIRQPKPEPGSAPKKLSATT